MRAVDIDEGLTQRGERLDVKAADGESAPLAIWSGTEDQRQMPGHLREQLHRGRSHMTAIEIWPNCGRQPDQTLDFARPERRAQLVRIITFKQLVYFPLRPLPGLQFLCTLGCRFREDFFYEAH